MVVVPKYGQIASNLVNYRSLRPICGPAARAVAKNLQYFFVRAKPAALLVEIRVWRIDA